MTFNSGIGALLTGMVWIMVWTAVAWLEDGVALLSDGDAAGSPELAAGCTVNELAPGVTVSTVAVLPVPDPPLMPSVGGPPKLRVSSPVSLAGVIVGAPL